MPRTGGGTGPFVLNPVYLAVPGTTILATQHNTPLEDIEDTFNIPQPIAYGGTQGASAIEAMDNLFIVGADKASSASIDLDNVTGSFVNITGTTPVTSIALAEGAIRFARAVAALPLTASASLIVNGSTTQAYTCEAGDQMMIVGYAGAIVRIWVTGRNKFIASQFKIADGTDQTKQVQFSASGLPTATTRTLDAPYYSGTLGLVSDIRGQIYGLTLSNNVADPINDIDIAAGSAVDSTGAVSMVLASSLTKRLDAAWAVGSGNGWLDTGSIANTTYHAYLIRRPDTGVVDSIASASPTAPTLPANYTQYAYIAPIMRVSGAIVQFAQRLDDFTYTNGVNTDRSSTAAQANALLALLVPNGIPVYPKLTIQMTCTGPVNADTTLADGDRSTANVQVAALFDTVGNSTTRSVVTSFRTNTSAQIRYAVTITSGTLAGQNVVQTWGFIDPRGRKA